MSNTKNIELTVEEANVLIQIIDIAQRNQGLSLSKSCVYFADKLQEAFKEEIQEIEAAKKEEAEMVAE